MRDDLRCSCNQKGFTLLEIIIVLLLLSILTAAAIPMVKNSVQREREIELRLALRQLRQAIDSYKAFNDRSPQSIPIELRTQSGFPKRLSILEEGFVPAGVPGGLGAQRIRFIRRIPIDPMTGTKEWGVRSYKDDLDSTSWNGDDVFDVYSKSSAKSLSGSPYSSW